MSVPEITPELLRAVADWGESRGLYAGMSRIRSEADHLEREQADEKRIDELAQLFVASRKAAASGFAVWEDLTPRVHDAYRAGIRAVLAKLEEEREPKFDKGGPIVDPDDEPYCAKMRHHPTRPYMCTLPHGHNGQHAVVIDGSVHATWDDHIEPLQWTSLLDVPTYIRRVTDSNGLALYRNVSDDHWELSIPNAEGNSAQTIVTDGPYTEVLGGDQ